MSIGILFDLDGTLLDTLEDLTDSVNHTLRQFGCPERTLEEIRSFVGNGAYQLIARSLPGTENDPPAEEVLSVYQDYYRQHSQCKTAPYPGILEQLREIAGRYPVAIVSNKPHGAVKSLCREFFGEIYALGQTDDCPHKPAPDMLFRAMGDIGVDRCVYVGDSEVDVATARNAGVPCLSVLWGFRDQACLENAGATHFCTEPASLSRALEALAKGEENGK